VSWQGFWESISVFQAVGWALGIAVVLGLIIRAWPKIRALVALIDSLTGLQKFMLDTTTTLTDQNTQIAEIHHETHKNDGSSIKDAVIRSEQAIERVELGVKGLYERADQSDQSDREIRDELERTRPKKETP
jgi:hypothetical protein